MATDQAPLVQPKNTDNEAIFTYVKSMLGYPIIKLEVTDSQLAVFLQHSLDTYSRYIPKVRWFSIPAFAGVQEYALPKDTIGYGIIEVMIPRLDPIAPLLLSSGPRLDIFGYRYSYPYRDISELFIDYFYFKEATRILSAEFDWEFVDGAIRIHPKPDENFSLTYASAFPRDVKTIPKDDLDWIRHHVLAQTKIAVGHVRRKFVIPGAQTGQQMDGMALVQEGQLALEAAEREILLRTPPFLIQRT